MISIVDRTQEIFRCNGDFLLDEILKKYNFHENIVFQLVNDGFIFIQQNKLKELLRSTFVRNPVL